MEALWQAVSTIAISLLTVAALALVRLITPTVRWSRQLKHDGEIYSSLPEGTEKEIWGRNVTAQAERLRIYREDVSIGDRALAWYGFVVFVGSIAWLLAQIANGWTLDLPAPVGEGPAAIPFALLTLIGVGFAGFVVVRLVLGQSIGLHNGSGGNYPKFRAARRAARRRQQGRAKAEGRYRAMVARKARSRRGQARRATG